MRQGYCTTKTWKSKVFLLFHKCIITSSRKKHKAKVYFEKQRRKICIYLKMLLKALVEI